MAPPADEPQREPQSFATTHWSLVLAAGRRLDPEADQALATLCQTYWFPLYAYVRRRLGDVHEAQDLTQEFFARLLEKDFLGLADPGRGRFRAFLLTALQNFLANEWDKARARKRGGGRSVLKLDFNSGESRCQMGPAHNQTAERLYERQWALTLLERVLAALRAEYAAAGQEERFEHLKQFLGGDRADGSYAAAAAALQITPGAAKTAGHRLRQRYRELLRAELARTVADPADVDDEIRQLFSALK